MPSLISNGTSPHPKKLMAELVFFSVASCLLLEPVVLAPSPATLPNSLMQFLARFEIKGRSSSVMSGL